VVFNVLIACCMVGIGLLLCVCIFHHGPGVILFSLLSHIAARKIIHLN
jgi:uncharacterized membrane protein YesL